MDFKHDKQHGFTMVEIALAISIIAIITTITLEYNLENKRLEQEQNIADKTITEIQQIMDAAGGYLVDIDEWPDFSNNCNDAINILANTSDTPTFSYLSFVDDKSPYNTTYKTACSTLTFSIEIESKEDYADYIARQLANTMLVGTTSTTTIIPRPVNQPALEEFLLLDGSRPMIGNLDMGGQEINNAGDIILADSRRVSDAFANMHTIDVNAIPKEYVPIPDCDTGKIAKLHLSVGGISAANSKAIYGYKAFIDSAESDSSQWAIGVNVYTEDSGDAGVVQAGTDTFVIAQTYCE